MRHVSGALAVDPEAVAFGPGDLAKLEKHLDDADRDTVQVELADPADVQLDGNGRLRRGGFRFTTPAMAQLCQKICPGLTKLAFVVSGLSRGAHDEAGLFSVAHAARIINEVAALRFDRLRGRQLVRNVRTGLIEGVTGASYYFLSNREFLDRSTTAVGESQHKIVFHEAWLCGRRLTLYYALADWPVAVGDDKFHLGYDLTNDEAGDCSVRASKVLLGPGDPTPVCLREQRRLRLAHSGRQFDKKLAAAVRRTLEEGYSVSNWGSTNPAHLCNFPLGFGELSEERHRKRAAEFVEVFCGQKLSKSLAERILRIALYKDTRGRVAKADYVLNRWGQKTRYDLLLSVMAQARAVAPNAKENLERIGYLLLHNKLNLPK